MENRNSADDVAKDSSPAGIHAHDFAEEFSSDSPSMATSSSVPSGSSPYASLQAPSAPKVDDRDVARGAGRVSDTTKKLEHALPTDPRMQLPAGFGMVDSLGRPPVVHASNRDVAPGAFRIGSSRNTATSRTFRSPFRSYDSQRGFTNEESNHEDGVPNSAAIEVGLYTVEAHRVPDGNEDGTELVAEAQYVRTKWYQRRWITLGSILCGCGLVVVVVVLTIRQPSASSSSSLTSPPTVPITGAPTTFAPIAPTTFAPIAPPPPTMKPISTAPPARAPITRRPTTSSKPTFPLTPVAIACNFLSISNVTKCRSTFVFNSFFNANDKTTGSTIPSEIGLLTQLTALGLYGASLTSTIPSEIGLLTQLAYLDFWDNLLTSFIPSEIGLLTNLEGLNLWVNSLSGTIPSEIGLLTKLENLNLSNNTFTSSIPSEIGFLTQLWNLYIFGSLLTSTIPSEVGLLTRLDSLHFDGNQLTSTVPSEIGLLTQLGVLDLQDNLLTGTIPSSLCSLPSIVPYIYIDCGEIACASGCCYCG